MTDRQYYDTPSWVVDALMDHIGARGHVHDPCAGRGAIMRALDAGNWAQRITGTEIDPADAEAAGAKCGDGLQEDWGTATVVINPPFAGDSWWPWMQQARERPLILTTCILLPLTVLSARAHLRRVEGCEMLVLPRRVKFTDKTPSWGCAWFILGSGSRERWGVASE